VTMRRGWPAAAAAALLLCACGGDEPAATTPQQARDQKLVKTLRAGGLVLIMRHSPADPKTDADESLSSCARQRNLTVAGREQATAIGRDIRRLKLPLGDVRASPMCRTRDTARLLAGRATLDRDLISEGVIGTHAGDVRRVRRLVALAQTPPRPGTDSLLVTHGTNIGSAFDDLSTQEGELLAFRPKPGAARPELVARLRPEDLARLAGR